MLKAPNRAVRIEVDSNENYHKLTGISNSKLSDFAKSPQYYEAIHISQTMEKPKPTDDMLVGTAVHEMLLEGGLKSLVAIPRKYDLRRTADKQEWAELSEMAATDGKTLISQDDYSLALAMVEATKEHPLARTLLFDTDGENEVPLSFWDAQSELELRCKIDRIAGPIITDIKTTRDPSPEAFTREIVDREYHRQGAFYSKVGGAYISEESPRFIFIAIGKILPIRVEVYVLENEFISIGFDRMETLLTDLAECHRTGVFLPRHYGSALSISVPRWLKYKLEYQL